MILSHVEDNKLYLVFQDFEDKIDNIYEEIEKFPKKTIASIKKILDSNFFNRLTLERQTNYINSISTYIEDVTSDNKQYYFYLFIIPKDININFNGLEVIGDKINKIEHLLIKLFKLYSKYSSNNKIVELFENFNGKNFLQLEADFYIRKLEKVYGTLLNYKMNYKNKIICSEKIIGEEIFELNVIEDNPLKNYQFIKAPYQRDLIKFIYSSIKFLEVKRLHIFKNHAVYEYKEILKLINKINNLLLKISTQKNLSSENITKKTIANFFKKYKNNSEMKKNKKLYSLIHSIFFTELQKDVQLFISIDLTKVFEKVLEKKLENYDDALYIGNEDEHKIQKLNGERDIELNKINFLLEKNGNSFVRQFPDFMIKNNNTFHIIDAKYKFMQNVLKRSDDIRQVLVYSLLFNKDYFYTNHNLQPIKKIILYIEKSDINIDNLDGILINNEQLDVYNTTQSHIYIDNLFNSEVILTPIRMLKQTD